MSTSTHPLPTSARTVRWSALVSLIVLAALGAACGGGQAGRPDQVPAADTASPAASPDSTVARGKYLVDIGGCNDCHTPMRMGPNGPESDVSQYLSGHPAAVVMPPPPKAEGPWVWQGSATNTAFAGPWGLSYAINLTPDEETGIGLWPEQVFVNAMKTGRHMGVGRPIMPPMPWPAYAKMTGDDLKAVYAYLKSLPPRKNQVPDAVVAEPPAAPAAQ
jgi:mono/diheme cytochrome c family protein